MEEDAAEIAEDTCSMARRIAAQAVADRSRLEVLVRLRPPYSLCYR